MNPFDIPAANNSADWLIFAGLLALVGIAIACFIIWIFLLRKSTKHRRRKRRDRNHRRINPTLAQTSGLPPPRQPHEPPAGT